MKNKIYIVYPYGLEHGIIEKEAETCEDGRMLVTENIGYGKSREWFSANEYRLTRDDAIKLAEEIRRDRMERLKLEYDGLKDLKFA